MKYKIRPRVLVPARQMLQLLKAYSAARYGAEQIFDSVTKFDKADLLKTAKDLLPVRVKGVLYPVSEQAAVRIAGTTVVLKQMADHGIADPPLYVTEVLEFVLDKLRDEQTITITLFDARRGSVNVSVAGGRTITCDISLSDIACNALQLDGLDSNILTRESIELVPETAAERTPKELYHIEGEDIKFESPLVTELGLWLARLDGWSLHQEAPFKLLPGEMRLFDGPISMHPLATAISPLQRIIQVSCVRRPMPGLGPLNDAVTTVHNGILYATNSRFIINRTLGNDADIIIPYRSIKSVKFEEKSQGRMSFAILIDHNEMMRDAMKRLPVPENTRALAPQTFSDTVLIPYAQDLVRQTVSALGITLLASTGRLWEWTALALVEHPLIIDWLTTRGVRAADLGSEFVASFYYFLTAIVEENEAIRQRQKA